MKSWKSLKRSCDVVQHIRRHLHIGFMEPLKSIMAPFEVAETIHKRVFYLRGQFERCLTNGEAYYQQSVDEKMRKPETEQNIPRSQCWRRTIRKEELFILKSGNYQQPRNPDKILQAD